MQISILNRLEIAHRALQAYEFQPFTVAFLQHSENLTFRVDSDRGVYLLRLHTPATQTFGNHGDDPATVRSEMLWLEALRKTGLAVPPPIKAKSGDYVSQVDGINVTLLAWQEGELLTREMESADTAAQIGTLVGHLHQFSSRWRLPKGFTRPKRDAAFFDDALRTLRPAVEDGRISYQDYRAFQNSIEILIADITRLRKNRKLEGLLHGDLHRGNFLLHEGQIRLIDFSMCAFGHFAYDLGTCLSNVRLAFHPIFLDHYTQAFRLPPNYQRLIEGYFLASYIVTFSLWITDANSQEVLIQRVPYIAREYAARFNRDERFWFNQPEFGWPG